MNYHEILLPELVFRYVCLCSWGVCSQNSVIHRVCVKNAIRLMSLNEEPPQSCLEEQLESKVCSQNTHAYNQTHKVSPITIL